MGTAAGDFEAFLEDACLNEDQLLSGEELLPRMLPTERADGLSAGRRYTEGGFKLVAASQCAGVFALPDVTITSLYGCQTPTRHPQALAASEIFCCTTT